MTSVLKLTPNSNNHGGTLPEGYDDIEFSLYNGDWCEKISLPKSGRKVKIINRATWSTWIDKFEIKNGQTIELFFSYTARWCLVLEEEPTYPANELSIPENTNTDYLFLMLPSPSVIGPPPHIKIEYYSVILPLACEDKCNVYIDSDLLNHPLRVYFNGVFIVINPKKSNHFRYQKISNTWAQVVADGTPEAPCPWHNGRGTRKNECYIILPSDARANPTLNPGDIWQARVDSAPYFPADGCSNKYWRRMSEKQITGIDNVDMKPVDGNGIYSNGHNNIRIDINYTMTSQGKVVSPDETLFRPEIRLINYETGGELDRDWMCSDSMTEYTRPVTVRDSSRRDHSDVLEKNTSNLLTSLYLSHAVDMKGGHVIQLGCVFTLLDGSEVIFSLHDKTFNSPPRIHAIPPVAFTSEQLRLNDSRTYYDNVHPKDHKDCDNYGLLHTWTAPESYQLTFNSPTHNPHYFATGDEYGKGEDEKSHWWMSSGGIYLQSCDQDVYTVNESCYSEFCGLYSGAVEMPITFEVHPNTMRICIYTGIGYSWINERNNPHGTVAPDFNISASDQYGTRYIISVSGCGKYNRTPALHCYLQPA